MGASDSKHPDHQLFHADDWQQVQWEPFTNIKDPTYESNFTVYAHKSNAAMEIEKYELFFNSQAEYLSYLETYYERKKYPTVVGSVHIEPTSKKGMCSTFHSAAVYLERIHFRLCELIEIPLEEGLYIMECSLEGYQKMFEKTGYFEVSADMVGINRQGRVKVWVNKNFAKNYPEFNKIDHNKNEIAFVVRTLRMIQQSIDYPKQKQKFLQYLLNKQIPPTFQNAKAVLKQYENTYQLCRLKAMKSILLWFKKKNQSRSVASSDNLDLYRSSAFSTDPSAGEARNFHRNKNSQMGSVVKKVEFSKLRPRRSSKGQERNNSNTTSHLNLFSRENTKDKSNFIQRVNTEASNPNMSISVNRPAFKDERKFLQLNEVLINEQSGLRFGNKALSKLPSVSFCYKSSGLYSPQNMETHHNEWFSSQRPTEATAVRQKKKQARKSLTMDMSEDLDEKLKFYYTSGDTHEIDPDIARDLYEMNALGK